MTHQWIKFQIPISLEAFYSQIKISTYYNDDDDDDDGDDDGDGDDDDDDDDDDDELKFS